MKNLGIEFPALVDEPDNRVERAYTGWPDRLYVIDRSGRIAHKSAAGAVRVQAGGRAGGAAALNAGLKPRGYERV